jgi:lipopolysaccharide biosynthesis glycosyltransferase
MYDLDMENYYYKGYRVCSRKFNHKFINNYICSGVLLINLKELRKNNITQQYYKFIKEKGKKLIYHDESLELLLNLVLEKVFIQSKKKYML